jgi:hypothetical protein
MDLPPDLEETLVQVADAAADASEPWWIIGSAAVALHGAFTEVRDVDLVMGLDDARNVLRRLGVPSMPDTEHPKFRSEVFGTWRKPPLPVEIFAGFRLADTEGWRPVVMQTRAAIRVARRTLYVPSIDELHDLLLTFGRPKDLERARLLHAVSVAATPSAPAQPPDRRRSSS